MSRRICQGLLALAVLYAISVAAFGMLHYDGDRPSAGTVIADFHTWLGFGDRPRPPPSPEPPAPEPPQDVPPGPVPPAVVPEPADRPAKTGTEVVPPEIAKTLDEVETSLKAAEVAARELRSMSRGKDFDAKRTQTLGTISTARAALNPILDSHPRLRRANALWDKVQQLHNAVSHL